MPVNQINETDLRNNLKKIDIEVENYESRINNYVNFSKEKEYDEYDDIDYCKYGEYDEYDDTLRSINKEIQRNPLNTQIWKKKGDLLSRMGVKKRIEALDSYDKALDIEPHCSEIWQSRGFLLSRMGVKKRIEALDSYDKALAINPHSSEIWKEKGDLLSRMGVKKLIEALDSYDKALAIEPHCSEIWKEKGDLLSRMGVKKRIEALDSYDKALAINPHSSEIWKARGEVLSCMGEEKLNEVLKCCDQMYELNPRSYDYLALKSKAYRKNGKGKEAIKEIDKCIENALSSDLYRLLMMRGSILERIGEYKEALNSYNKAIIKKYNKSKPWLKRGLMLIKEGKYPDALTSIDISLRIFPDNETSWKNRQYCLKKMRRKKNQKGYIAYRNQKLKNLQLSPNSPVCLCYYGDFLRDLNKNNLAIKKYQEAIQQDPNYIKAYLGEASALYSLKKQEPEKVEEAIFTLLEIEYEILRKTSTDGSTDEDCATVWTQLGEFLYDLGEYDNALSTYEYVLEIQGDKRKRSSLLYKKGLVERKLFNDTAAHESYKDSIYLCPPNNPFKAIVLNELGNLLGDLSLDYYQDARTCYEQALDIDPQYWRSWNNLGSSYINELKSEGFSKALEIWTEGLNTLDPSLISYEEGCGNLHYTIAKNFFREGKIQKNYNFWCKARKHYNKASNLVSRTGEKYKNILKDLYIILVGLKEAGLEEAGENLLDKATQIRQDCHNLIERLIYQTSNNMKKKQLSLELAELKQVTVNSCILSNKLIEALEIAEQGKNACLTWLLLGSEPNGKVRWKEEIIQKYLKPEEITIYWHLSPISITTFILKKEKKEPIVVGHSGEKRKVLENLRNLEEWIQEWNNLYVLHRDQKEEENHKLSYSVWQNKLPSLLKDLGKILNIEAILRHIENSNKIILVPHRDLHRFPLHALFPDNVLVCYLPSIKAGIEYQQSNKAKFSLEGKFLSFEKPRYEERLPYAEIESLAIAQMMNSLNSIEITRLLGSQLNRQSVKKELNNEYTFFHFTGHATYDFKQPQQSSLILNDGEKLTLNDILELKLGTYYLVSLSACETAITKDITITHEYVGLVSGFLNRGATRVVSTLWTVSDVSSCVIMTYFYLKLKKGKSPEAALSSALKFIRLLTISRLNRIISLLERQSLQNVSDREVTKRIRKTLRDFIHQWSKSNEEELNQKHYMNKKIFDHEFFYCPFIITGI